MKEFDYIIIGGGCAGLSLAYELEINEKLKDKTLAIIEPRAEYKKDKTWSFWKVATHNFDDCVKKNWKNFTVNIPKKTNHLECVSYPYQSIDSGLFYEKINNKLKENKNIFFFKDLKEINSKNSFVLIVFRQSKKITVTSGNIFVVWKLKLKMIFLMMKFLILWILTVIKEKVFIFFIPCPTQKLRL